MDEVTQLLKVVFGGAWDLFSSVTVPGFGVSAAKVAIGFVVIKFSLNLFSIMTGFRSNIGSGAESITRSNETLHQYSKVKEQNDKRAKNGGIGFRY